ncbi:MAG: hypothetical protein DSY59_05910 [Persephonella sp.]|nr:MAG: hypothetical protein DSY59_05910 [Persephonella sp.]
MKKYLKNINFRIFIGNLEGLPFSFFLFSIISFSTAYMINLFLEYKFFSIPKPIFNLTEKSLSKRKLDILLIEEIFKYRETAKNKGKILLSSNDIKLVGILWVGSQKLALIETDKKKRKFLEEGDSLGSGKVIKITNFYIEIGDNEGIKRVYISIKGKLINKKQREGMDSSQNVKEINLKRLNLNRNVFSLMKDIVIRPYRKNGKKGLIIESISDTTLMEELGLKEGDIIISINGMPIISEATFVNKIISTVNSGEPIELVILRNGKEERIRYNGAIFR